MTKTKRQLRAEAVERLKNMDEWCDGVKNGADFVKALLWDLRAVSSETVRDALIDLLTDEEPPEGDVLDKEAVREIIERNFNRVAIVDDGSGKPVEWRDDLVCSIGFDFRAIADEIADMVERDYVRRESFNAICDDAKRLEAERDRLERAAGRDADVMEALYVRLSGMTAERDEWKAKAERSKTEQNGVTSNLEWLWESDPDFIADWASTAKYCRHCAFWDDCDGSVGADDPKCIRGNREWLMSEHVDESGQNPDMFEKEPVCVRDGGEMSETCNKSSGNVEHDTRKVLVSMPYHNGEKQAKLMGRVFEQVITDELHDTREKLKADVRRNVAVSISPNRDKDGVLVSVDTVFGWLDRQAAITEREVGERNSEACRKRCYSIIGPVTAKDVLREEDGDGE